MDNMVKKATKPCFKCQLAKKKNGDEILEVTNTQSRPWDTVYIDEGRPYADGHYNLVLINKRTRYPVVESVPSTSFQTRKERLLNHTFATSGTRIRAESNNGAPFNTKEFNDLAME